MISVLEALKDPDLRTVEILPGFHEITEVIVVDGHAGIPKTELIREFIKLRQDYYQLIDGNQSNDELFWNILNVVLLVTYDNVAATNARKRLLESHPDWLYKELRYLNVLFCSPLQKHTKSSMLWYHRFWVRKNGEETGQDEFKLDSSSILEQELAVVLKAAELHPKNYYAWTYARRLIVRYNPDRCEIAKKVYEFIKRHIADISAWSFLDFLVHEDQDLISIYFERASKLDEIAPDHEAIAWFLRSAAAKLADFPDIPHLISSTKSTDWVARRRRAS